MPVQLSNEDLKQLKEWFPLLSFDRDDQINALLHMDSADFQAVPGSGKTTLLGAKLALIARKWPYANRGICILTHTNVATQEIEQRLRKIPNGEELLGYPHYIGTIQTFINKYFAIPWLRESQIELKEIDDEAYADRILGLAKKTEDIKGWLFQKGFLDERSKSVRGIRYSGPELTLTTSGRTPLPAKGKTITALKLIKSRLTREGWLRYDDMFAFAERAMQYVPTLADTIAHRFPLVFMDEMQDTSDLQLDVLCKAFFGDTIIQRFGDINQSILNRGDGTHMHAFPKKEFFEVSSSLRFGRQIADVANRLKLVGGNMEGHGGEAIAQPALILYSDATIQSVVHRFGVWTAEHFTSEELASRPIKAVCGVKREGNAKQQVGRHIKDYVPSFVIDASRPAGARATICRLVRDAGASEDIGRTTIARTSTARLAVLKLLGHYGRPDVRGVTSWNQLRRILQQDSHSLQAANRVVLDIVEGVYGTETEDQWIASRNRLLLALENLIEVDVPAQDIAIMKFEIDTGASIAAQPGGVNTLRIDACGKSFDMQLSTIAGVKGETHLATLVLESCVNKQYDLSELIPYLLKQEDANQVE
ncbi:UvrD-helicase domain-containing protein [Paraburkholderia sp. MMS20-SJTR3]|uniref:DNA 3'-5' helicase II n=1 Tax=Paraburkholderia sejongensis TaxID=2886946 RepID=A0ABS8K610_9BURK|nr:UvrD-helicase domain-containing protein [Paraburkholderia sp. MMS20-SJTR3]MCC8397587.1 UvrD-helicase domain-containing protein [Paraburkholderia sp. MMS20-SJTR3]